MRACKAAAAVLLLLCSASIASASLMAIDLGSEFLKVSLIKPGRTPIAIVVNEMSKRKTPALVGFAGKERLLGEEASSFAVRYPETTFMRAKDLLAKPADDPSILTMLKEHNLPYKVVPHPIKKLAAIQVSEDLILTPEELVASTLQYAKQIAEAQSGSSVPDAVIAVPAYYGQAQRQAILDSAALVGINVLGLINTYTAAALQFGIERDFTNKTQHVIFYDMGSGATEVSLVKYSSFNTKEAGQTKAISQLEVKDVDWDAELGSNSLDSLLVNHFAKQFADKHKVDLNSLVANPRSMAKMKKQVRRTKEMLSANTAAPISVEELHDGKDFQSSISREEFESLAGNFFERAAAPLKRILDRSGLKAEEIEYVEMLGGGTRVPRLQAALSEALGGRGLDRHVDSDEAVVMGASLFAANLSASFRLRKFGMADISMYGISLQVDEAHTQPAAPGQEAPAEETVRNLLPYMKKLPSKRLVHWANLTADPLRVSLAFNSSTPHPLPPGYTAPHIASFNITGINTVIARYNQSGNVNLRFEAGYDGILRLSRAEAVVEYYVTEQKQVPIKQNVTIEAPSANTTTNSTTSTDTAKPDSDSESEAKGDDQGDAGDDEGKPADKESEKEGGEDKKSEEAKDKSEADSGVKVNSTADTPPIKYETITIVKKRTAKVSLNVSTTWSVAPLEGEVLAGARQQLGGWVAAELTKRATAAAKNELEAYIIRMREVLESDEKIQKVTTSEQRDTFRSALADAEDWLYMDGEAEAAPAFRDRLAGLKKTGDAMETRAKESEQRPVIVSAAKKEAELKSSAMGLWAETKPWITEDERSSMKDKIAAFLKWLDGKEADQSKKADHEDPAYEVQEVVVEYTKLDKAFNKLSNKKKPKPPPEPPAPANATANGTTDSTGANSTGTDSGGKGKEAGKEQEAGKGGKADDGKAKSKKETAAEAKARKEAEAKAKKDAEAKAKKEAAAKAKKEADAKAKAKKEAESAKAKKDKAKQKAGSKSGGQTDEL